MAFDSYYSDLQENEEVLATSSAWDVSIGNGSPAILCLSEHIFFKLSGGVQIKLLWNGHSFEVAEVKIVK